MKNLQHLFAQFPMCSPSHADGVLLTQRIESKAILRVNQLPDFLNTLQPHYQLVADTPQTACRAYRTDYYDSPGFDLYLDHHNRRPRRTKVRRRHYPGGGSCWLEVKYSGEAEQVLKKRQQCSSQGVGLDRSELNFVKPFLTFSPEALSPVINSQYTRFTLLAMNRAERITVDLGLVFSNNLQQHTLHGLCVVEVKHQAHDFSEALHSLKKSGHRLRGLSKYCLGINYLYPSLKKNNFLPRLRLIERLSSAAHGSNTTD